MFSDHKGIKPEISNKKVIGKSPNTGNISNILNNPWVKEDVSRKIFIYTEINENKNIPYQNVQDTAKAAMAEMYSTFLLNAQIRKEEKSQINNLSPHHKNQKKKSKINSKPVEGRE